MAWLVAKHTFTASKILEKDSENRDNQRIKHCGSTEHENHVHMPQNQSFSKCPIGDSSNHSKGGTCIIKHFPKCL